MKIEIKDNFEPTKEANKNIMFFRTLTITSGLLLACIFFMVIMNVIVNAAIVSKFSPNDNVVYLKEIVTHICKIGLIFAEAISLVPFLVKLLNDTKLKRDKKINSIKGIICCNIVFAILIICTVFFYHPIIEFFLT